jgi:hypothetical protein
VVTTQKALEISRHRALATRRAAAELAEAVLLQDCFDLYRRRRPCHAHSLNQERGAVREVRWARDRLPPMQIRPLVVRGLPPERHKVSRQRGFGAAGVDA